jgi:hypothetical protein
VERTDAVVPRIVIWADAVVAGEEADMTARDVEGEVGRYTKTPHTGSRAFIGGPHRKRSHKVDLLDGDKAKLGHTGDRSFVEPTSLATLCRQTVVTGECTAI